MVINNILDHIFSTSANLAILRILNERVVGVSGRETARLAGINLRTAQIALNNLDKLKIIKRQVGAREHLFTLNRNSFITKEIISKLFTSEQKFKTSLYNEIKNKLNIITDSIILFGSVARKEESVSSDLDLCIVYSKYKTKIESIISELRDEVYDKYGVTIAPYYITTKEFNIKSKRNKSPVNEIIKDGIVISGLSINKIING